MCIGATTKPELFEAAASLFACRRQGLLRFSRLDQVLTRTVNSVTESAEGFAQPLAELGQLARSEHEKRDAEDDEKVHRLKESFEHDENRKSFGRSCALPLSPLNVPPVTQ